VRVVLILCGICCESIRRFGGIVVEVVRFLNSRLKGQQVVVLVVSRALNSLIEG
jgi:hypothetical protein